MAAATLVRDGGRGARSATGVTRGTDVRDGGVSGTVTGEGTGAGSSFGAGVTTGSVNEGSSSPAVGFPYAVGLPRLARLIVRPSRTAWDSVPANDGFWSVAIRAVNSASATLCPVPNDRWIGGSPAQATGGGGAVAAAPTPVSGPTPDSAPAASRRPPLLSLSSLNLSSKATPHSSVLARVTRDAICSA
ncbi:hypothetical protein [Streptomyces mayteni]